MPKIGISFNFCPLQEIFCCSMVRVCASWPCSLVLTYLGFSRKWRLFTGCQITSFQGCQSQKRSPSVSQERTIHCPKMRSVKTGWMRFSEVWFVWLNGLTARGDHTPCNDYLWSAAAWSTQGGALGSRQMDDLDEDSEGKSFVQRFFFFEKRLCHVFQIVHLQHPLLWYFTDLFHICGWLL